MKDTLSLSGAESSELMEKRKAFVTSRQGTRSDLTSGENSPEVPPPRYQLAEKAGVSANTYKAEKLAEALRPKAKENLSKGGGDQNSDWAKMPTRKTGATRREAAKETGK